MESTESQLRFGTSLAAASDPSHPGHPLHQGQGKAGISKDKRSADEAISMDKRAKSVSVIVLFARSVDLRNIIHLMSAPEGNS